VPAPELELELADRATRTGSEGSAGPEDALGAPAEATDRCTGASAASSPSSSPSPVRWIVVRMVVLASAIGPVIVDRLTTGGCGAPTGRAEAGRIVGSPTPRRGDEGARTGSEEPAAAADDELELEAAAGATVASRLTAGMADRATLVLDGARRIPPDGAGRAVAAGAAPSAAGAAWDCAAWLRWTGGRMTDAADVSGRSGTRIALRETVGSDRTGVISGTGALAAPISSSSPPSKAALSTAADLATTGAELPDELAELEVLDALAERAGAAVAATGIERGSGS